MPEYRPTKRQTEFLSLPYSIKEAFYGGSVHAGKTDILLLYPLLHKFHEASKFKGLFLRRTYGELELEVIPRSKPYYKSVGGKYNGGQRRWEFPSGAILFFGHVENEDDVHKYDSAQPNYVAFDELTSFTEWQYLYITLERCRTQLGNPLPAIVRSGSNPGNVGHTWVKRRFIDPAKEGRKVIQGPSGLKRIFIRATVYDNPYTDPEYLKSLESLPEAEKQAKLYGNWDAFEGSVFNEFRDKKYPDEPDNACHVIEPCEIPEYWPKVFAIDWGFRAMTWVGCAAISPNGQVVTYKEMSWKETKIEEWAGYVRELVEKDDPRLIKMCRSAGQERGTEHTIQQQVSDAIGRAVTLTTNNSGSRVSGKMLLHEYFRWKAKYIPKRAQKDYDQANADFLFRNRSPKEYQSYIDSFIPPVEEVLPKALIFNTCPQLISAIKACVYDKNNPEDVAEFDGDDPYDGYRYLIDSCDKFINESQFEFKKVQDREALIKQLEKTGDQTAFYRNAAKLDNSEYVMPVKRFHRRAS